MTAVDNLMPLYKLTEIVWLNTSRQYGWHFEDDIFNSIFVNEYIWTSNDIPLKLAPKGQINNT